LKQQPKLSPKRTPMLYKPPPGLPTQNRTPKEKERPAPTFPTHKSPPKTSKTISRKTPPKVIVTGKSQSPKSLLSNFLSSDTLSWLNKPVPAKGLEVEDRKRAASPRLLPDKDKKPAPERNSYLPNAKRGLKKTGQLPPDPTKVSGPGKPEAAGRGLKRTGQLPVDPNKASGGFRRSADKSLNKDVPAKEWKFGSGNSDLKFGSGNSDLKFGSGNSDLKFGSGRDLKFKPSGSHNSRSPKLLSGKNSSARTPERKNRGLAKSGSYSTGSNGYH